MRQWLSVVVLGLGVAGLLAQPAFVNADAEQPQAAKITRIEFTPASAEDGGGVFIALLGSGSCSYTLDFGDGTSEKRTADLPDRVRHSFPADGEYLVVATPQAPCEGVAQAKLDVRAIDRGIWGLSAESGPDPQKAEMTITVKGRGGCTVTLDLGDGTVTKETMTLPETRKHTYQKAGVFELKATAAPPCRGEAGLRLEIKS